MARKKTRFSHKDLWENAVLPQVLVGFLWNPCEILAESLWDPCEILVGSLRDLAGSLRDPCGILAGIPDRFRTDSGHPDRFRTSGRLESVQNPTIFPQGSHKDPARIPQGSHKDLARIPQGSRKEAIFPRKDLWGNVAFPQTLACSFAEFVCFLVGILVAEMWSNVVKTRPLRDVYFSRPFPCPSFVLQVLTQSSRGPCLTSVAANMGPQ